MRLLHIADAHLDAPFASRSVELRRRLRDASREAFRRAMTLAQQERVHAVVIAGDLFDGNRLSFGTEKFLLERASRLRESGIPVIYATGNHDPGESPSRRHALPWPDNVTVVDGPAPVRVAVADADGRPVGYVTAAGHDTPRVTRDLSRAFQAVAGPLPQVAVLHTNVLHAPFSSEHERYAPSVLQNLSAAGFDYWALGHVHRRQCLSDRPAIHYPGSLQGLSAAETGAKGCLLVDLSDRESVGVAFREVAPIRWETVQVRNLARAHHLQSLSRVVQEAWQEQRAGAPGAGCEWIVRVELAGATSLWKDLAVPENRAFLEEELAARLSALHVEIRLGPVFPQMPTAAHRARTDVLGEALRLLDGLAAGEDTLPDLTPGDLAGYDPTIHASVAEYVREATREAGGELLARLLAEPDRRSGA